jgi:hypothetical protein
VGESTNKEELPIYKDAKEVPNPSPDCVAVFKVKKPDGGYQPYVKYSNGAVRKLPFNG